MITYQLIGSLPRAMPQALLPKIASACRGVRGLPKGKVAIGLRFVAPAEIRRLNRAFRGKDKPTDVLSFSVTEGKAFPVGEKTDHEAGDLVVCPSVVVKEARRRKMGVTEELVRMIVHGTLHLAGMDHATQRDEEKMFGLQEKLIGKILDM